jgi:uncharacterized tellurite resistance protein B-like protein
LSKVFLLNLSNSQKRAFPTLATAIVHADGRASVSEEALMARLQAELGLGAAAIFAVDEALAAFRDPPARRAALIELVGIAWCDGDVADAEAALLDCFAEKWSIGPEERIAIFNWVERQTALWSEADRLIRG